MPIYEYECSKCGNIEEAFQRISDPPLQRCRKCEGSLKKLISQSSFHLKGTGWYATDYSGGAKAESAGKSTENKSETSKTSSPKEESSKA